MYPLFALIIKLQSRGPAIYKQLREGKDGIYFMCFKFRSMHLNDESDNSWTKVNDPRVTRFGVFLRRTSLDEFPQFLNVFKGNMSIVGPRPFPKHLFDNIKKNDLILRHSVKPGMTGYCQINFTGKKRLLDEKISQDMYFVKNYSILLYLSIIIKTPQILFKRYINNLTGKSL